MAEDLPSAEGRCAVPVIIFGKWPFVLIVLAIFLWWRYTQAHKDDRKK